MILPNEKFKVLPKTAGRLNLMIDFETPGPLTDAHGNITGDKTPLVAMVDDTPSTNKSRLPPSIKALKERPGVKITDFHSTVDSESL